jgi:putative nucleotidyltransferase with HDIG domain
MFVDKIDFKDIKEGDILAYDIKNKDEITLVSKETVLNRYIIDKLSVMNLKFLYIYKNKSEDAASFQSFVKSYQENLKQIKILLDDLASGKQLDYQIVTCVSKTIYSSIRDHGSIVKYLQMLRNADEYTYTHSMNTAFYAMLIGKWLGFPDNKLELVIQSGLLHDIGKTQIPSDILNKKGSLTNEEYDIIKKHTIYGLQMLEDAENIPSEIKKAILYHHERTDGSGYPFHATSEKINKFAKIIAVSDVFDAMTSDRVYKKRATPFDAFEMFLTNGRSTYDAEIINIFVKKMANFYVGSDIILSNGQTGRIVFVPPYDTLNPIVQTDKGYIDFYREKDLKIETFL